MPKWQNLARPDDIENYNDVINMFPNSRGTYETGYGSTGTNVTASGASDVSYAAAFRTLTGATREYVIDAGKIWEFDGASLTDRTGGVAVPAHPQAMMAQFGNATILVASVANPTVASTGGNFAAVAAAPQGEIVLVHANIVLVFNTNASADGWAGSDAGDYTNWTTGESASGRIFDSPGPITAACVYGGHVYVFKSDAIYRMTYIGGQFKWQIQMVWKGNGIFIGGGGGAGQNYGKYQACPTKRGIAFLSNDGPIGTSDTTNRLMLFDGSSAPVHLNPLTTVLGGTYVVLRYNPAHDVLTVAPGFGSDELGFMNSGDSLAAYYHYYCFSSDMWSRGYGGSGEIVASGTSGNFGVVQGDYIPSLAGSIQNSKPIFWAYRGTTNTLVRSSPARPTFCVVKTARYGRPDGKTTFSRLIPLLRRRTDLGSDSVTAALELYRELEDTAYQVQRNSLPESSQRKQFDLMGAACSDNFAVFYVLWSNLDVELDGFLVKSSFVLDSK